MSIAAVHRRLNRQHNAGPAKKPKRRAPSGSPLSEITRFVREITGEIMRPHIIAKGLRGRYSSL